MGKVKSLGYKFTNSGRQATIDIFDFIGDFGITASNFKADLESLDDFDELIININSGGGDVFEGFAIYNLIRSQKQKAKRTTVNITGIAGSIASVIAMGAEYVNISDNAFFFIHNVSGGVFGTAEDMRKQAEDIEKIQAQIVQIYERKTNQRPEFIQEMMDAETMMNAEEAFRLGFVDNVTAGQKLAAKIETKDPKEIQQVFNNQTNIIMDKQFEDLKNFISNLFETKKDDGVTIENILDNEEVKAKITEIENKISESKTEKEGFENKLEEVKKEFENKVSDLTNEVSEKNTRIAELEAEIEAKKGEIETLKAEPVGEGIAEGGEAKVENKVDLKGEFGVDYNITDLTNAFKIK